MIQAGKLRHRITLQTATETNVDGNPVKSWSSVGTFWAFVQPISGSESTTSSKQVQADTTHNVTMRCVAAINSGDRFLFGSRVLQIVSVVNEDELNSVLKIICKETHG